MNKTALAEITAVKSKRINNGTVECAGNFGRNENNIINFKKIDLTLFNGSLKSSGIINIKEKEGKFKSVLKNIDVGKLIDFYDAEKTPQFKRVAGNVGQIKRAAYMQIDARIPFYAIFLQRLKI